MSDSVYDCDGKLIAVGTRVRVGDDTGAVRHVSDWDGDLREGRMVGFPPRVYVVFGDDSEDYFTCSMRPDERTYCEDLEVIP